MSACEYCGRPKEYGHHPTGKDEHGRYLDRKFTLSVCHDHHTLVHDDWRTLGIEKAERPLTFFERVEIRLRRFASNCARLDKPAEGGSIWGMLAAALITWADELAKGTSALDAEYPGWRDKPGFYRG